MRLIASRQDHLDNQQATAGFHGGPAVTENRETLWLTPIVNDVREQIGVASTGNLVKKTARLDRDAVRHPSCLKECGSIAHDMRKVVEDAVTSAILSQYCRQQIPRRSSNIDNDLCVREIVGRGHSCGF